VHTSKTAREKNLEKALEEAKQEMRAMNQELGKLRNREQTLSAEN